MGIYFRYAWGNSMVLPVDMATIKITSDDEMAVTFTIVGFY